MDGKVVLVTGGARGQGREHALRLAREGADIALFDLAENIPSVPYDLASEEDLQQTAAEVEALGAKTIAIKGDVRKQRDLDAAVERAIAELGDLDVLVHNAGIWAMSRFWETPEEEWLDQVDVNLTAHWRAAKAVAPHFIARRSGAIVFTSSGNGLVAGENFAHYTAAKHGVIGLMKTVAIELGPYGVRANAVCPGFIDTPMNTWQGALDMMAGGGPGSGSLEARSTNALHMGALAGRGLVAPGAVSQAVLFLASDEAADVTGVALPVDAGRVVLPGFNPNPVPAQ